MRYYYTLTFTHTFEHDDDSVFFSYSVPYTLSDLRNDLQRIDKDASRSKYVHSAVLCKTLSGVDVPLLTITQRSK